MSYHDPFRQTVALDEILLDVAVLIELSPRDRRIAENRYRLLKEYLERKESPLAPYLTDEASLIYAQGSMATSTTIVSGTKDDRFDVDAIVEMDVPLHWNDERALDELFIALKGFPGATGIERCTRCVQLQFPFMHMDVTIMDRRARIAIARAGQIFHSPDRGPSYRVDSNPWGFTDWFRTTVGKEQAIFANSLSLHRAAAAADRLYFLNERERHAVMDARQLDLPPMIPNSLDAQEAVALKLLKRYLNLQYEHLQICRPPSIYLTKRAGDIGYVPQGLSAQLFHLADTTAKIMRGHIANGTRPEEFNPSYRQDRLNDRWPRVGAEGLTDMRKLAETLEYLADQLKLMASSPLSGIAKMVDLLFGEQVGRKQREIMTQRYDRRGSLTPILAAANSGAISAPSIVVRGEQHREVPRHNFHPMRLWGNDVQ